MSGSWSWKFCGLEVRWPQDRVAIGLIAACAIAAAVDAVLFWVMR